MQSLLLVCVTPNIFHWISVGMGQPAITISRRRLTPSRKLLAFFRITAFVCQAANSQYHTPWRLVFESASFFILSADFAPFLSTVLWGLPLGTEIYFVSFYIE
ncbi:hypothetical protein F4811DRAFT_538064 [Daldinia bambusicola]|nr:hypothetical protein F4811DRAFT_538064 [Daldinia bambusicola]